MNRVPFSIPLSDISSASRIERALTGSSRTNMRKSVIGLKESDLKIEILGWPRVEYGTSSCLPNRQTHQGDSQEDD